MKFLSVPALKCAKCYIDLFTRIENDQLVIKHLFVSECDLKGKTFIIFLSQFEVELDAKEVNISKNFIIYYKFH